MKKALILAICLLVPVFAQGADSWQMVAEESHLKFTVSIMGNPSEGEFTSFSATINFDPEQLEHSRVSLLIDLTEIEADYSDVTANLKKPEWFDVAQYPKARFASQGFKLLGGKDYQVTGDLTLRDVTRPETLIFTLMEYGPQKAVIKGQMMINRLDFGIGQGDWQDTSIVTNEIFLDFMVTAHPMK